jgi:hypothetical protein
MKRKSATADWVGSDSPNKPGHKIVRDIGGGHFRPMNSGDYLARNVRLVWFRCSAWEPAEVPPQCAGPEHDH